MIPFTLEIKMILMIHRQERRPMRRSFVCRRCMYHVSDQANSLKIWRVTVEDGEQKSIEYIVDDGCTNC
jgi:hypothetical protein